MRKISLAIILILVLCSCASNQSQIEELSDNPYILPNGFAPTEVIDRIEDFILGVYMPADQDDIDNSIKKLSQLATENEITEIKETVGQYDLNKQATVSNIEVSMCTPDNSSTYNYKILATFNIKRGGQKQNMLIEFKCNSNYMIDSHSIWINNDTD